MEVKVQFTIDLPHELIAALNLNEDTAFQAVLEEDRLTVRVCGRETVMAYYDDGFSEGYDAGTEEGFGDGHTVGYQEGLAEGYERGYLDGIGSRPDRSDKAAASREGRRRS